MQQFIVNPSKYADTRSEIDLVCCLLGATMAVMCVQNVYNLFYFAEPYMPKYMT